MKLVVNLKLKPTRVQAAILKTTLETANEACNDLSAMAWATKTFGQYALHKLGYRQTRKKFSLAAQMAVRCISKVADAYKLDKKVCRRFRKNSAQPYDDRIIRFAKDDIVSLWTTSERQKIPFVMGDYQRKLFAFRKGEVDLMRINGKFYLAAVCDIDDPELIKIKDVLGVDMGVVNLATDSSGRNYSGESIARACMTFQHRRKNLQRKQTRSAKRKLKKISGKQARFQKDVNHIVSKAIVADAKRTESAIALEDLGGIRTRVTARRRQRARLSNWGFFQLRCFLSYKAKREGIPIILVDPRYTSQQCPECGHTERENRKTQNDFKCIRCGHAGPADKIAARNIRFLAWAQVKAPMVAIKRAA